MGKILRIRNSILEGKPERLWRFSVPRRLKLYIAILLRTYKCAIVCSFDRDDQGGAIAGYTENRKEIPENKRVTFDADHLLAGDCESVLKLSRQNVCARRYTEPDKETRPLRNYSSPRDLAFETLEY